MTQIRINSRLSLLMSYSGYDMIKCMYLITVYDILAFKVNDIKTKKANTSGLITKTQYESDKQGLEKKIEDADKVVPNTRGLVKKSDYSVNITEIKNKISSITGIVTTAMLNIKVTKIEKKILDAKMKEETFAL